MCFEPVYDRGIEAKHVRGPDDKGFAFVWRCQEGCAERLGVNGEDRRRKLNSDTVDILVIGHGLDKSAMVVVERAEGINDPEVIWVQRYLPGRECLM